MRVHCNIYAAANLTCNLISPIITFFFNSAFFLFCFSTLTLAKSHCTIHIKIGLVRCPRNRIILIKSRPKGNVICQCRVNVHNCFLRFPKFPPPGYDGGNFFGLFLDQDIDPDIFPLTGLEVVDARSCFYKLTGVRLINNQFSDF